MAHVGADLGGRLTKDATQHDNRHFSTCVHHNYLGGRLAQGSDERAANDDAVCTPRLQLPRLIHTIKTLSLMTSVQRQLVSTEVMPLRPSTV